MMNLHSSHKKSLRRTVIMLALLVLGAVLVFPFSVISGMRGIANSLPLHMLLETFAIVVAMLVFAVGWHTLPGNIVLLACAFFGVGMLDFLHMLSYSGMPDFVTPGNVEKSLGFWLTARLIAAAALLVAVAMPWRPSVSRQARYWLLAAAIAAIALAFWLFTFHLEKMPRTFTPGQGLTAFKRGAEYFFIALNLVTALMLWKRMHDPLPFNAAALFGAVCAMALSEFFFTLYASITDIYNLFGHIYKVVSYLFLYRAIFVSTIEIPYRQLQSSETRLRTLFESTGDAVMLLDEKGFFDCNKATLVMFGCATKDEFCFKHPAELSPPQQPSGADSMTLASQKIATTMERGSNFFEWVHKRADTGRNFSADVLLDRMELDGRIVLQATVRDTSRRKQEEDALQRSEARFRTLFESTSDALVLVGDDRFMDCNQAALAIFGCATKEELLSKHPADISPSKQPCGGDSRTLVEQNNAIAIEKGGHGFEWVCRRLNTGNIFPAEVLLDRMELDGKTILQATVRDITERKQAEDTQRKLYQVVEQSPSSIVITDHNANIEYVNRAFVRETGYSIAEAIGKNPRILNSGKNSEETYRQMWSSLKRGEAWRGELINRRKDGSEYVELVAISPVRLADGSVTNYLAIKENITERKVGEAKMKRLSQMYRLLSRVNEAIVRAKDRNLLFEAVCHAAMESDLFRLVWIGMVDKNNSRVLPIACSSIEDDYMSKLGVRLDDEKCRDWPIITAIRENTHVIWQDIKNIPHLVPWWEEAQKRGLRSSGMFPIREAGIVVGTMNVYSTENNFFAPDIVQLMLELTADISFALDVFVEKERRKQMAEVIVQLNTELEHRVRERTNQLEFANKELEAFSYSVSHDLRAPLRSIDGFSRTLSRKYHDQLDATGQGWLERICRASQHMGHLIDDMLKLSQVTRGTLRREQVDLSKMAGEVVNGLRKTNTEREVRFVVQQGLTVQADPGLMRIAMDNLLGNAWKYSSKKTDAEIEFGVCDINPDDPSGVGRAEARLVGLQPDLQSDLGEERAFFVRDNGAGFNMDYAGKLFGAFQRLHTANEFDGTGIGLATVQRIVHRHNGKVWAEGKEEQGATFYFTLPQRERGGGH